MFLAALFLFSMIPFSGILNLTAHAATSNYDVKVRWRATWSGNTFSVRNQNDGKTSAARPDSEKAQGRASHGRRTHGKQAVPTL